MAGGHAAGVPFSMCGISGYQPPHLIRVTGQQYIPVRGGVAHASPLNAADPLVRTPCRKTVAQP